MKYKELLARTEAKKIDSLKTIVLGLKGPYALAIKNEIANNPGSVAWNYLAKQFCEELSEHFDEFLEEDEDTAREVSEIMMAYQDGDDGLYDILPVEAQLFTE